MKVSFRVVGVVGVVGCGGVVFLVVCWCLDVVEQIALSVEGLVELS